MALRNILTEEDPSLYKKCRAVTDFNPRLHQLLDDMAETLQQADGVGLAAPQVGVLRRAVLVLETNVPEGEEPCLIELVNPEIIEASGEQHLSHIGERGMKAYTSMLGKLNTLTPKTRDAVISLLKLLFSQWVEKQGYSIRKTLHLPIGEWEEEAEGT